MSKSYRSNKKNVITKPTAKPVSFKEIHTTFYVKPSASFVATIKQIQKMMKNCQKKNLQKHITVVGMGRAVGKTLSVSSHFLKDYKTQVFTKTITVIDERLQPNEVTDNGSDNEDEDFENEETVKDSKLEKRLVSGIEVHIYTEKLN